MGLTELVISTIRHIRPIDIVDMGVVAFVVYHAILLVRGTRAMAIVNGIVLILALIWISSPLATFNWLLRHLMLPSVIAVVVIFQPELRMALERLGRAGLMGAAFSDLRAEQRQNVIAEIVDAATDFSQRRIGALIVIERRVVLGDVVRTGRVIDGLLSHELLAAIFEPHSPLHDGAVVVRGERLLAAACVLPHSERPGLSVTMGMRHRAALGITERTDAVAVVVSEETGNISLAADGTLSPALEKVQLTDRLMRLLGVTAARQPSRKQQ